MDYEKMKEALSRILSLIPRKGDPNAREEVPRVVDEIRRSSNTTGKTVLHLENVRSIRVYPLSPSGTPCTAGFYGLTSKPRIPYASVMLAKESVAQNPQTTDTTRH